MITAISILTILGCCLLFFANKRRLSISEKQLCLICEQELTQPHFEDGLAFCSTHFQIYKHGNWKLLHKGHATSDRPENGVSIYKAKTMLCQLEIPSFITADYEYKDEQIITVMSLMVLEENFERAQALSKSILN